MWNINDGNKNVYLDQQQQQQQNRNKSFNHSFEYIGAIHFDLYIYIREEVILIICLILFVYSMW